MRVYEYKITIRQNKKVTTFKMDLPNTQIIKDMAKRNDIEIIDVERGKFKFSV